jgi:hypothetical protein
VPGKWLSLQESVLVLRQRFPTGHRCRSVALEGANGGNLLSAIKFEACDAILVLVSLFCCKRFANASLIAE